MSENDATSVPERKQIDARPGATVLEFGTASCGHCRRAQPLISAALVDYQAVEHLQIEDGRGRALGRSYGVKLWPTLIFLADGVEVERLVRPQDVDAIRRSLSRIDVPQPISEESET